MNFGYTQNATEFEPLANRELNWDVIDNIWNKVAILICNPCLPDCPIIFANDKFLDHTRYSRHEILGKNCRLLQGPKTEPEKIAIIRNIIREQRTETITLTNYRKDGSIFLNKILMTTVKDRNTNNTLLVGIQKAS